MSVALAREEEGWVLASSCQVGFGDTFFHVPGICTKQQVVSISEKKKYFFFISLAGMRLPVS